MQKYCNPYQYQQITVSAIFKPVVHPDLLFQRIVKIVCSRFKVTHEQLRGNSYKRVVSEPRHIVVYFIYKYVKNITQEKIGAYFNRDHSTVINSIKCVKNLKDTDANFKRQLEVLEREVLKALTN